MYSGKNSYTFTYTYMYLTINGGKFMNLREIKERYIGFRGRKNEESDLL